jgi:hypothetical protein
MPTSTGKLADAEWRRARAAKAGRASQTLDAYITKVVNRAPELNAEQIERLRALLPPIIEAQGNGAAP